MADRNEDLLNMERIKLKIQHLKEELAKYETELKLLEMKSGHKEMGHGKTDAKKDENASFDEGFGYALRKEKISSDSTCHSQQKRERMSSNTEAKNEAKNHHDREEESSQNKEDLGHKTNDSPSVKSEYIFAKFSKNTTERYSRQIILDPIGVKGQEKLLRASVLIIGCGGIGSPCIQYLAACGIGTLGLVDYDRVELSNLHRQVIHSTATIGQSKVASAKAYVRAINPNVSVRCYDTLLDSANALDIVAQHDVILDASDNPPTRYLVNDACVKARRPLISASALGLDGQLCVLNHKDAPCYRCLYPLPPPPETVGSCGENGVLGPVPGLMGTLQAIEAVKLLLGMPVLEKLLLYDAERSAFLAVKLRAKKPDCICAKPSDVHLIDYERFCSSRADDKAPSVSLLVARDHISVGEYRDDYLAPGVDHILLDVRSQHEFDMVRLRNAVQVDMRHIGSLLSDQCLSDLQSLQKRLKTAVNIFVICRRGNDSQKVVLALKDWKERLRLNTNGESPGSENEVGNPTSVEKIENGMDARSQNVEYVIKNIKEGYYGWHKYIDDTIPIY